ncbi:N-acetylmuramoyl-L-alanine amidase [Mycobacterium sp. ACS4331]|uniref:N-acetylmuramoyl-L-alanine amidase n=1 Tax=Mycobacterium sp. ACS4331 TaxID=1834121 RepID=UPI0007FB9686|nr:N-acetylmuramoyl-L-alanine amidase [Mycobacterium sp. ACS4331]OBF30024.1 cold-shock protein [Mycobacterium sp. ACS4331]
MPRRSGRRPPPALLLTAIAATAVILPWAVDDTPAQDAPSAANTRLVEQPLDGLGGGESIREVSQATPFSMVAITGDNLTGTSARVRAKRGDGSWGPWYSAEALRTTGSDDAPGGSPGTDPVFVGNTTAVQIAVTRPKDAPVTTAPPKHDDLGYRPASTERSLGQNLSAILISPPQAPVDVQWTPPTAAMAPGQPPPIITRAQWGAAPAGNCGTPVYDDGVRAGIVHHTAGSNDYAPEDSAAIVRAIWAYHTATLGWCDIAYNALVDKYGQVFEGRAGGLDRPVEGSHTGGFNRNTFGVAMLGEFSVDRPTDAQLGAVGRLLGWRLGLDHVDPRGTVVLTSAGGEFTHFARGSMPTLPTIFTHRDVGNTECPGAAALAAMDTIRDLAARFSQPAGPVTLEDRLRGGAIYAKWQKLGGPDSILGAPTSPEASADGDIRYATFERGAMYWSPSSGAAPVTGAIYAAWGSLGYERGRLGLPTSGEIHEPLWIKQNFQHGTLNFDRETGLVTRVVDGVAQQLPAPPADGPPVQLERFTPISVG